MEVVVVTVGAIRCIKLQSVITMSKPTPRFFTGWMTVGWATGHPACKKTGLHVSLQTVSKH